MVPSSKVQVPSVGSVLDEASEVGVVATTPGAGGEGDEEGDDVQAARASPVHARRRAARVVRRGMGRGYGRDGVGGGGDGVGGGEVREKVGLLPLDGATSVIDGA